MRIDDKGNFIPQAGFNGVQYQPRDASNISVYLGEASAADIAIQADNSRRAQAELKFEHNLKKERLREAAIKVAQRSAFLGRQQEASERHRLNVARVRDRNFEQGLKTAHFQDTPELVGNHLAGFGQPGEHRIHSDSVDLYFINDKNIPVVEEYGKAQSMQPFAPMFQVGESVAAESYVSPADYEEYANPRAGEVYTTTATGEKYVTDSATTSAIKYLTQGPYNPNALKNLPATIQEMTPEQRQAYQASQDYQESLTGGVDPKLVKYAAIGLLALLVLRR